MDRILSSVVGLLIFMRDPRHRDERGLSQSAENAVLLAGAATIAAIIIGAITVFVQSHLPK